MAEILEKVKELQTTDPRVHWFCGKIDQDVSLPQTPASSAFLEQQPGRRLHIAADCFMLFAFESAEITAQKKFLVEGIDKQLCKCDVCIVEYYKCKRRFLDGLHEEYDDDDVETLANLFSERDFDRIRRGLHAATATLKALPPERRSGNALTGPAMFAVIEALSCEAFLMDDFLVRTELMEPFTLVQTNDFLGFDHFVPAMCIFLFGEDTVQNEWALRAWQSFKVKISKDDFEYAIRGGLSRALAKSTIFPVEISLVYKLWRGLKFIVDLLNTDMITHSLRALDVDIYRLALEHLAVDSVCLRFILKTLTSLLEIGPKDFWDAMGAIGPNSVAEQVFRSPKYGELLQNVQKGDLGNENSAIIDLVGWVQPFMKSLQLANQPPVCRTVAEQLMSRFQASVFPIETRIMCFGVGVETLSYTLVACNRRCEAHDVVGRETAAAAVTATSPYIKEVIGILDLQGNDFRSAALSPSCTTLVENALALECKIFHNDYSTILEGGDSSDRLTIYESPTWRMVESKLLRNNINLALAVLGAASDLLGLGSIEAARGQTVAGKGSEFNVALRQLFDTVRNCLDKINSFNPAILQKTMQHPKTASNIVTLVYSVDGDIHEAGVELIKSVTGDAFRIDALRSLLRISLHDTLSGAICAAQRIAALKAYRPCPRFLKISTDVLDALCDSQDGLLRDTTLQTLDDVNAVKLLWENQWKALKMMYEHSEEWSIEKVASTDELREFVRDIMQFSEHLFDQYPVFDNAISRDEDADNNGLLNGTSGQVRESEDDAARGLLNHPSQAMKGVVRYLRLKDEYLLRTSVKLVRKLLAALTSKGLLLSDSTSEFLAKIAIYNGAKDGSSRKIGTKSLLTPTEIAGITLDLETNLGRPIVQEEREKARAALGLAEDELSRSSTPDSQHSALQKSRPEQLIPLHQKKKQGTIDLETWGAISESARDGERKPVVKLPETPKPAKPKEVPPKALVPGLLGGKSIAKPAVGQRTAAQQEAFLNERKKQKLEAEARRAEEIAKIKGKIPGLNQGQTGGEGSALSRLKVTGRDHAPKGENMMVSESESDSDDEFDKELFGEVRNSKPSAAVVAYNASKLNRMQTQGPVKKTRVVRSAKDMRARLAPQMTGLYATILSWDFFHDGDFPPGSARENYSFVTDTFRTTTDYRRAFEALLLLEAWSSLQQAREEGNFKSVEVKVSNRISVDSLFEASVSLETAVCKEAGILEADILLISKSNKPAANPASPHCLGRVSRIKHKRGTAEITVQVAHASQTHTWLTQNSTLHAIKVESIVTLEREYGALAGLEWYDLCQEIIRAEVSPILKYNDETLAKLEKVYKTNKAQARAIQSAVDNDAFTLIQGPPGSGKTKTIVAIVGALLTSTLKEMSRGGVQIANPAQPQRQQQANPNAPASKKLLVCAPSNAAVDELVMRFMDGVKTIDGTFYKPKVVRLGRSDKINPQVVKVTLDDLVDKMMNPNGEKAEKETTELEKAINAHKVVDAKIKEMYVLFDEAASSNVATAPEMTKKFEMLKREKQSWSNQIERLRDSGNTASRDADIKKRHAEQMVLSDAHIICSTLSGSARETFQNMSIDFETVVIDEAAQCIELSAVIPLKYGCSKCIMVGDPKQLPPTVLSREAARFQYEQSLFVRMQKNQPNDVHLLDTQYRMHPEISRFPSTAFYDGRLLDGPNMAHLRTRLWHEDSLLGPYRFYDVVGKHETSRGHSLVNMAEIEVAIELYRRLTGSSKGFDFTGKIGVITPYKAQLRLLGERFRRAFGEGITKTIEFNTTDAFQGRESEVIIFSCVRASEGGIGFLSDIRRMNVGITRAKSSLWVLGNSSSLKRGEYWSKMIVDAQSRNLFTKGNVSKLLRDTPKCVTGALKAVMRQQPQPPPPPPSKEASGEITIKREPSSASSRASSSNSSSSDDDDKMEDIKFEEKEEQEKEEDVIIKPNISKPPFENQPVMNKAINSKQQSSREGTPGGGTKRKRELSPGQDTRDAAVPVSKAASNNPAPAHPAVAAGVNINNINGNSSADDGGMGRPTPTTSMPRPPIMRRAPPKDDAMFIKPRQRKR